MEDSAIIELFWQRNQQAIAETAGKYGSFCFRLARNIVTQPEDAEECVSDTYLHTWNAIPPQRPQYLKAWLGTIVRNLALTRWRQDHRQKRYAGLEAVFEELAECIPDPKTVERTLEARELTEVLNRWLRSLPRWERVLFLRRYWYGESLQTLAKELNLPPQKVADRMYRLRKQLRRTLEREGFAL